MGVCASLLILRDACSCDTNDTSSPAFLRVGLCLGWVYYSLSDLTNDTMLVGEHWTSSTAQPCST